jgi:hypothetical protein
MGRSVIVGDLHGCSDELRRLLDKTRFTSGDALYVTGDLLSRGPDPKGVLAVMKELGARGVRGNHDDGLVRWRAACAGGAGNVHLGKSSRKVADLLDGADFDLLESLPLWLDLDPHGVRLVHAGVIPGVPIDAQPSDALLLMRYLGPNDEPIEKGGTVLWGTRYVGPPHVVFGHNARVEPQLHPWATGIDTAAVYGGLLTALVLEEGEPVPPVDERRRALVSVAARERYYTP